MKIAVDDILAAIAEKILSTDEKKRATPMELIDEVCREKYGLHDQEEIELNVEYDGWDVYFTLLDLMREKSKEYGYTMRKAPLPEDMNWGMPYVFEYIFTPNKKDSK